MKKIMAALLLLMFLCSGCGSSESGAGGMSLTGEVLRIVSGSENKELKPILADFTNETGIKVEMTYMGSLDIMHLLKNEHIGYDALWPASSLWISLGDRQHRIKHAQSISLTPVAFGIKESLAQELGFVGAEVSVADIMAAIQRGQLSFCMTSATQSNSGASAYMGFLYALAGHPAVLSMEDLQEPELQSKMTTFLQGVDRSSGSSEWLKTMFLEGDFDAMVNYESLLITTNQSLVAAGKEPLYLVYPYDGLSLSDSPLGFVADGGRKKEEAFLSLQSYLLSEPVQKRLLDLGRRTSFGSIAGADPQIFNPSWGIDPARILSPFPMPQEEVIWQALTSYQGDFRKPSLSFYCLDFSGSMHGTGEQQVKAAMEQILDQKMAASHMLQATPGEKNIVIAFNNEVIGVYQASGNGQELEELYQEVKWLSAGGGTNLYVALEQAIALAAGYDLGTYTPAIVVLSDGASADHFAQFAQNYRQADLTIPIFSIMFADADERQLNELATLSNACVFDGRTDLIKAFKSVKGYY